MSVLGHLVQKLEGAEVCARGRALPRYAERP